MTPSKQNREMAEKAAGFTWQQHEEIKHECERCGALPVKEGE